MYGKSVAKMTRYNLCGKNVQLAKVWQKCGKKFQLTKVWQNIQSAKILVDKSVAKMLSWQVWQKCPVGKNDQLQTVWQKCTAKVWQK